MLMGRRTEDTHQGRTNVVVHPFGGPATCQMFTALDKRIHQLFGRRCHGVVLKVRAHRDPDKAKCVAWAIEISIQKQREARSQCTTLHNLAPHSHSTSDRVSKAGTSSGRGTSPWLEIPETTSNLTIRHHEFASDPTEPDHGDCGATCLHLNIEKAGKKQQTWSWTHAYTKHCQGFAWNKCITPTWTCFWRSVVLPCSALCWLLHFACILSSATSVFNPKAELGLVNLMDSAFLVEFPQLLNLWDSVAKKRFCCSFSIGCFSIIPLLYSSLVVAWVELLEAKARWWKKRHAAQFRQAAQAGLLLPLPQ